MQAAAHGTNRCWKLAPLILHPFADPSGPSKLIESSRASLIVQGLIPSETATREQLDRTILDGRFCEIRMLYYVGKDLIRWIEQSIEMVGREESLKDWGIEFHSFVSLLIEDPPPAVREKLVKWGVADYRAIFSRAIGLNMIFAEVPEQANLTENFIRHYFRYADHIFECSRSMKSFAIIRTANFDFDLYASGEYSRMLERSWSES